MSDLLFYYIIFGIILLFLLIGEKTQKKQLIYYGYLLLFLLSALRYDIGNDYANYWFSTEELVNQFRYTHNIKDVYEYREGRFEIGFCALISLFAWSDNAFVWISCILSAIVVYALYKTFSKYSCHFWGIFLVVIVEYVFLQWDWIRQSGAFSLVLLALISAKDRNWKGFLIFIILASLLHKSAIFLLVVYPLTYVKINNKLIFSILIIGLMIYWSGILDGFVTQVSDIFSYVDGYDKYDSSNAALSFTHTTIFSRIRLSLFVLIGTFVAFALDERYAFYRNLLTVGFFIYMLGASSLLFTRIAWYFIVILFPCFGICMQQISKRTTKYQIITALLLAQFVVFSYDVATDTNTRGCVPYKSVFSNDFATHKFDIRDY